MPESISAREKFSKKNAGDRPLKGGCNGQLKPFFSATMSGRQVVR